MDTTYRSEASTPPVLLSKETLNHEHVETKTNMFIITLLYYLKKKLETT